MEVPTAEIIDLTISPPQWLETGMSEIRTTIQRDAKLGRYSPDHQMGWLNESFAISIISSSGSATDKNQRQT